MKRAAVVCALYRRLTCIRHLGAAAQEPYYKGKRLTVLINFAAGGPTDLEGRLFAKHLGKHIAGQPNVIVQNMDGAGGVIGAQYRRRGRAQGRHRDGLFRRHVVDLCQRSGALARRLQGLRVHRLQARHHRALRAHRRGAGA